jgi:primosomal protein N' (replication factor Y) (superfamily II helicase)
MNTQRDLFSNTMPWEDDDQLEVKVAQVVFAEGLSGEYDYVIPDNLLESVRPGSRIRVPLGKSNREVIAYCIALQSGIFSSRLKNVLSVVDDAPLLDQTMLELTQWLSARYCSRWGQAIESALPAAVRNFAGTRAATVLTVPEEILVRLPDLELPPKQAKALRILAGSATPLTAGQLAERADCGTGPIQQLRKKNLVHERKERITNYVPPQVSIEREQPKKLTADQEKALKRINQALSTESIRPILLHGVTGSGKTEIYIQAIEEVVRYGRQAIVLVPEISLTPQTRQRFQARFDSVAVLHSHQSDVERASQWKQIARGGVQVVVGARSAVFAPVPRLGLIVLDEEHDGSFKQQDQIPRYHARDVAIHRCRMAGVPLILGSATPALETYFAAKRGDYQRLVLPQRVTEQNLPSVQIVDTRGNFKSILSRPLQFAMRDALAAQQQVILLLNRRGHSSQIQCPSCGFVLECDECSITLTHHKTDDHVICHYCGKETPTPKRCGQCGYENIRFSGIGTQRLEEEVRIRFRGVTCLRMDSDSMKRPGSHEIALAEFRRGEHQVLLGTQMIAKGLDFPNVTVVGVINADSGLHMPNFRASERTFQLVTQVAGRSGRGDAPGSVFVQTLSPDHPAIIAASNHDYEAFAKQELEIRREYSYPPWTVLLRVIVRGERLGNVEGFAEQLEACLKKYKEAQQVKMRLMGPAPAPIIRLRNRFRYHLLVLALEDETLQGAAAAMDKIEVPRGVQWVVDVDPVDLQ